MKVVPPDRRSDAEVPQEERSLKIGMLDVDGHNFPNLAQMKLSAWYKAQGDEVERLNPMMQYDAVAISKVFSFTPDYDFNIQSKTIAFGGSGYAYRDNEYISRLDWTLPDETEHIYPDYSLYGITDTAYGFLTRGCPRDCHFCIVSEKEGRCSNKVADLSEFWRGQKEIQLLDPNILACKVHSVLLDQLIDSKAKVEFNQGLDARFVNNQNIEQLKRIKLKTIHFAWDDANDFNTGEKLELIANETGWNRSKIQVYVLVNFNSTLEQDLHRIMKIKAMNFAPYVMVYDKDKLPKGHIIRHLQRYVNNRYIFWSKDCETFEDYKLKIGVA